jgi:hypothetical protein
VISSSHIALFHKIYIYILTMASSNYKDDNYVAKCNCKMEVAARKKDINIKITCILYGCGLYRTMIVVML